MPVDTGAGAESVDPAGDPPPPPPILPAETDALLAAILDHLAAPLGARVAEHVAHDRDSQRHGGNLIPVSERAAAVVQITLSDVAHELRQIGYRPTKGERLVRQYGTRLAERTVRKYLLSLEVSPESVDSAAAMLWNDEASNDKFRAVAQASAAKEKIDPEPLRPKAFPDDGSPDHD
jgi:hypothetical protein